MSFKLAAVAALALIIPATAQAATFDAFTSFNATQGAGNFYYGTSPDVNTSFTLFGATTNCFIAGSICLQEAANYSVPGVTKSTSTSVQYGTVNVPDDRLLLHPGSNDDVIAAIFSTPVAGTYDITATFNIQDSNPSGLNVWLLTNPGGTLPYTLTPLTLLGSGNLTGSYVATMQLNAGDLVGFAFDNAGSFSDDSFGLNFTVSDAVPNAVPEPASWAMMIGGFAMLGAAMRGRRRAVALA